MNTKTQQTTTETHNYHKKIKKKQLFWETKQLKRDTDEGSIIQVKVTLKCCNIGIWTPFNFFSRHFIWQASSVVSNYGGTEKGHTPATKTWYNYKTKDTAITKRDKITTNRCCVFQFWFAPVKKKWNCLCMFPAACSLIICPWFLDFKNVFWKSGTSICSYVMSFFDVALINSCVRVLSW